MWTCPTCNQTIPELISVKYDKYMISQNQQALKDFCEASEEYIAQEALLEKEVREHNERKSWYEPKWELRDFGYATYITYPLLYKVLWITKKVVWKPRKVCIKDFQFLECPMCHFKQYLKDQS